MAMPIYSRNAPVVHDEGGVFVFEFQQDGGSLTVVLPRHQAFVLSATIREVAEARASDIINFDKKVPA